MFVIGCFWGKFLSAKEKSSGSFNFGSSQTSSSAAMFRFRVEFFLSNCCTKEACRTCRADTAVPAASFPVRGYFSVQSRLTDLQS